ncbi:MAG: ABC transporter permease [Peptoniphilaceae bacterium]|nr:ABC transporter permease [Peptoniphilaceae bacterium]MDD7383273.1 ABC transporter permease [Peptoniphilaceae bacterium]MDY3737970.1 ABC transporter permease [Peptoniphilaceae bacterium]
MEKSTKSNDKLKKLLKSQRAVAFIALIIIYGFFYIMSPAFRSKETLTSIFDSSYYAGFLAIGVTFTIATGGFDLSMGTAMIASALIGGYISQKFNIPIGITIIIIILTGLLFGCFNGFLITKMGINPFIATLGTQMIANGLGSIVTNVQTVNFPLRDSPQGWYKSIFRIGSFPTGIILLIAVAIIMGIILHKMRLGRYILALGSNKEATRLSGINVNKYEFLAYALNGLFVGFAAVAYAATYTTVMPGEGSGFELDAIAAAVLGGTSLQGGVASITGTVLGLFIMTILKVGLPFIDLQAHYQTFITGFVILLAVYLDVVRNRKKN